LLHLAAVHGSEPDVVARLRQLGPTRPFGLYEPFARGEPVAHYPDVQETNVFRDDPVVRERLEIRGIRTWLAVALQKDGVLLGVINVHSAFDRPVTLHDGMTKCGQRRATAVLASVLRRDERSAKASVEAVNKQPGPPVRHPQLSTGLGNRPVLVDHFHQLDLARPNRTTSVEVDAQCEPRHGLADGLASGTTGEVAITLLLRVHFGAAAEG
jgi:hypothetical protein